MVRLTRIYTRGGDRGETSLGGGERVAKHDLRVAAFGTVDEANSAVGVARLHTLGTALDAMLARIQNDLFDLGADLCTPEGGTPEGGTPEGGTRKAGERKAGALRVVPEQVVRLEQEIDALNADLAPLDSFVLPGGSAAAAQLHVARTVTRRAERLVAELAAGSAGQPGRFTISKPVVRFPVRGRAARQRPGPVGRAVGARRQSLAAPCRRPWEH